MLNTSKRAITGLAAMAVALVCCALFLTLHSWSKYRQLPSPPKQPAVIHKTMQPVKRTISEGAAAGAMAMTATAVLDCVAATPPSKMPPWLDRGYRQLHNSHASTDILPLLRCLNTWLRSEVQLQKARAGWLQTPRYAAILFDVISVVSNSKHAPVLPLDPLMAILSVESVQHYLLTNDTADDDQQRQFWLTQLSNKRPQILRDFLVVSDDSSANQAVIDAMIANKALGSIAEFWPRLQATKLGAARDTVQQAVIHYYLQQDPTTTLVYLTDHYQITANDTQFHRRFDFPKALNTLLAWHFDSVKLLTEEEYDKDSTLVIDYLGQQLAAEPVAFFAKITAVQSEPLQHQMLASIMQAKEFFSLDQQTFTDILSTQPASVSAALARAYALQYQHLQAEAYAQKTQFLQAFLNCCASH